MSKTVNKSVVTAEQEIRATGTGTRNARNPEIRTTELAKAASCGGKTVTAGRTFTAD